MKKIIALFLVCFLLVMCPIRGYAVSAPLPFGIGEEIILPFLLSLLGVQRASEVESYEDLASYNDEVYDSLIESLSGLAGMEVIQEWLFKAVNGLIETDSIVWQKLREFAISNFSASSASGEIDVSYNGSLGNLSFKYYNNQSLKIKTDYSNNYNIYNVRFVGRTSSKSMLLASDNSIAGTRDYYSNNQFVNSFDVTLTRTYTYNNLTVYYADYGWSYTPNTFEPDLQITVNQDYNLGAVAWLMVYGGYSYSDAVSQYSNAFSEVLTSQEKEDIIDGTNVIQLYNPAELQNGLEIIPGGDPDDDPNLRKIPFAVTADWWNFLQQFGKGAGNQFVNAYNALNGLDEGTSIGRISDAYDSLGIASVGAAAAAAAEGILNLTDNNIYPQNESVADTITNTIPGNLTPVTPDSGIDNESEQGLYKLPDLRDYFPFCIPFDLINLLSVFVAEPETPEFVIALSTGWSYAEENVSLDQWNGIANMVRNIELAIFVLGLILITRNIIRG